MNSRNLFWNLKKERGLKLPLAVIKKKIAFLGDFFLKMLKTPIFYDFKSVYSGIDPQTFWKLSVTALMKNEECNVKSTDISQSR